MEQELHSTTTDDIAIYKHDSRPDWGHAVLAWERGRKRAYQFEDGKLRVFRKGWYHRLENVDMPLTKSVAVSERLRRKLGLAPKPAPKPPADALSFEDQLALLSHNYSEGFEGDDWGADKRGEGAKRRLKRHRDAAVADARTRLAADRLDGYIAAEQFDDAWADITDVLRGTDLVTKPHLAPLEGVDAGGRRELVLRTRELLWGEGPYEVRFERFVGTLAMTTTKEPSWQLATALSALVFPDEHVCVRPTAVRAQAAYMAPRLRVGKLPTAPKYVRIQAMVHTVRDELVDAGHAPRDLLDVYDFMWTTLRPTARKQLADIAPAPADAAAQREAA